MSERHSQSRFRFRLTSMSVVAVVGFFVFALFGIGPSSLQPYSPTIAEASHCGGSAQCNAVNPHLCQGECKSNLTCAPDGIIKLIPGSCGYQVSPLSISSINVANITSSTATITWTTNKVSSSSVNYGLSSFYGTTVVGGAPDSTSHSVTLTGLEPSTTYHYQVESETGETAIAGETARSTDRTFITSSGTGGGSGPTITFGPRVDATNDRATVVFNTSPDTAAMVEYETNPNTTPVAPPAPSPGYQFVCDAVYTGFPCPPPQQPTLVFGAHSILLTGLTQANSEYRYKITIVDSAGNVFATNEFTFRTSSSSTDHVFSTGGCNDNTPIGQCNIAGQYCRPGGGAPIYDCRPNIPCPKQCGTGFTCQATGDCSQDPALTGSPSQCNQEKCYKKCNNQSGRLSGTACTIDSGCVDTKGNQDPSDDSRGRCITGSFTNPAVPGCVASWPSCDANVILKVRPDRVCDKWLTCKTSVPLKDESGKTENQCFDLSICNSLSLSGQCNKLLEGRQCDNDPLRFCASNSDCLADGKCLPGGSNIPITYSTPSDVSKIQNLSGYAKAGLEWSTISRPEGPPRIEGFYPLSVAQQVGTRVDIPNGDFEQTRTKLVCSNNTDIECRNDDQCTPGSCNRFVQDENFFNTYWDPLPSGANGAKISLHKEGSATNLNRFLRVEPTKNAGSGATTKSDTGITTQSTAEYLLTVRMKSSQPGGGFCSGSAPGANDDGKTCTQDGQCSSGLCGGQHIKVSMKNDAGNAKDFGKVVLSTGWRTFRLGPITGPSGQTNITFTTTASTDPIDFWIDDLALLPALKVNDTDQGLLAQNCRLYPKDDAPACDFTDQSSITYRGLKGYCLERDPLNTAVCLSWWPVDILSGQNIFGQDQNVGYSDRRPLYACAESAGQLPDPLNGRTTFEDTGATSTCDPNPDPTSVASLCGFLLKQYQVMTTPVVQPGLGGFNNDGQCGNIEDRKPCKEGTERGFCTCADPGWSSDITASGADADIRKSDIEFFRIVVQRYTVRWYTLGLPSEIIIGPENDWQFSKFLADGCDHLTIKLTWDTVTQKLLRYYMAMQVCTSDSDDEGGFTGIGMFAMREKCTKLVEVATPSQVTAWADRTSSSSTYVVPDLNYRYISDLAPFATAAPPSNVDKPSDWLTPSFLSVEGPDIKQSPPYQARAGGPYACVGNCSTRWCSNPVGSKKDAFCLDSSDCFDQRDPGNALDDINGTCVGAGVCLRYDSTTKRFSGSKQACTVNRTSSGTCPAGQTCCPTGEECIGGAATNKGAQSFNPNDTGNKVFAMDHLKRLFAKAYSLWNWNAATFAYEKDTLFTGWNPPTALCKVCSGGTSGSKACLSSTDCGADSTCVETARHPTENAGTQTTADYCAIKPSLTNVVDAGNTVGLDEGASYVLKFNSNVDREQRPLRRVTIDWGDCETNPNCTTNDTVSIAPRDDPNNPHAYTHVYHCGNTEGSTCTPYQILLQIEDNWGWCDNGLSGAAKCRDKFGGTCTNPNGCWMKGPIVTVKP